MYLPVSNFEGSIGTATRKSSVVIRTTISTSASIYGAFVDVSALTISTIRISTKIHYFSKSFWHVFLYFLVVINTNQIWYFSPAYAKGWYSITDKIWPLSSEIRRALITVSICQYILKESTCDLNTFESPWV